jgi:hypothetical protein
MPDDSLSIASSYQQAAWRIHVLALPFSEAFIFLKRYRQKTS